MTLSAANSRLCGVEQVLQALVYRQLPNQFAPVVIAFDEAGPIFSDGDVPAN